EAARDARARVAAQLEAGNGLSRALASSLEQDKALDRFLRELSGVFEFERLAIVLVDGDEAVVMANAGLEAEGLYPRGTARPAAGSVIEDVARESQTIVRGDMDTNTQYPEGKEVVRAGRRSPRRIPSIRRRGSWPAPGFAPASSRRSHREASSWGCSLSPAPRPMRSPPTRPTCSRCSRGRSAPQFRTCARTHPSATQRRSSADFRRSGPTSSRSSRMSSVRRWPR